jgi:hypothetical protein
MKKNIITGVLALSAIALLAGGLAAVQADSTTTVDATATSTAWAKGPGRDRPDFANLTAAEKTALEAKMAARLQEEQAKQAAIKTAITNNDYAAWVTAEGTSSPFISKITAANFPQYVQAYNLRQQADQIMTSLGLGRGEHGEGPGGDFGGGHGPGPIPTDSPTVK